MIYGQNSDMTDQEKTRNQKEISLLSKTSSIRNAKKKKRKCNQNQDDIEGAKAALELDEYFNKISSLYKSVGHVGEIVNNVLRTFRDDRSLREKEIAEIVKSEKTAPVIWQEVHQQPSLNPPSLDFPTGFSFNISKSKNTISKLPVFSSFSENSENIEIEEEPTPFTKANNQPLLSSIFATEKKSIQNIQINKKIHLDEIGRSFDENYKRKTTALFFTDSISKKLHGYMKLKGIDYKLSTDQIDHEILEKIVLLRFEFKLDEEDVETQMVALNIRNTLSIESFNNFLNVSDQINKEEFALREYSDLFKPEQMRKKLFGIICANTILNQLSTDPWKFDPSSALYYYSQLRKDEENNDCYEVGVLTLVENFFDFHIQFNQKQLF